MSGVCCLLEVAGTEYLAPVDADSCRELFSSQAVARLATIGPGGPHLVPIVFAIDGDTIVTAIDQKPKRTHRLQRVVNIEGDARVVALVDHYDENWDRLWWVRADGAASILRSGREYTAAIDLLVSRYQQYQAARPDGPVIAISVARWSGWQAAPSQ